MSAPYDLGFLGGGQLARMSIQAAQRMGLRCISLDPEKLTPSSQIADSLKGQLSSIEAISRLASLCERLTLENEFVAADAIRAALSDRKLEQSIVCPSLDSLATIQDKLRQREALLKAGVPCPQAVELRGTGKEAIDSIGFPMVLKARFGGYDGKGTRYARDPNELADHHELWADGGWLAESFVPFRRELAAMVFVSEFGTGAFPTMETVQANSVCDLVFPSGVDASETAIAAVKAVAGSSSWPDSGRGLFGVELFELHDGSFQVNEIAPRPHNSGHYTLDWGGVSQFEQHVRLAMGYPPIIPSGAETCMANLFGQGESDDFRLGIRSALDLDPNIRVHWYGKAKSRVGRKMGHINAVGNNCVERAKVARTTFYGAV